MFRYNLLKYEDFSQYNISKQICYYKQSQIQTITIQYMRNQNIYTSIMTSNNTTPIRNERMKKFVRKPSESSERSSSRKSIDSSTVNQMYIKSPMAVRKTNNKQDDFFQSLASSIIKVNCNQTERKNVASKQQCQPTDRTNLSQFDHFKSEMKVRGDSQLNKISLQKKISTLEAQLQLRNHQISLLSSECQRNKKVFDQEKEKRKKIEVQKKQVAKQLKQVQKNFESLKTEMKKIQKQRQCLLKQIEFQKKINYDDKTRSLQSYREKYLEQELQKIRKQLQKSRGEREEELQNQIKMHKQQRYTIQSHLKATKLANQCLIKQINHFQQNIHDFVLNSEQYKKLRDKYVRFLEQYKLLRNQYWSLKAQMHQNKGINSEESQIFSISASQVENDLSIFKSGSGGAPSEINSNSNSNSILQYLSVPNGTAVPPRPHASQHKPKQKQKFLN